MADPKHCPKCDQPHARCAGHVKNGPRKGQPCMRWPRRGATVCRQCGGNAPQTRAAGQRRVLAEQVKAEATAVLAHEGLVGVEDPVELLGLVASEISAAKDAIARRVNALDSITVAGAPDKLRAEVSLWLQLLDRTTKAAEVLAKLDLEGRRTSAAERWADEIARLVQALLSGLELSPVQWERVPVVMSQVLGSRPLELEEGTVS